MCDCCKKIIVQTNTTTTGSSVDFISDSEFTVTKSVPYDFNYTTLADGDYILQLELDVTFSGVGASNDLTSQLIKNNILETNINNRHRITLGFDLIGPYETTFTHNCKITGVTAGDTLGFTFSVTNTNVLINNGSITVIKL